MVSVASIPVFFGVVTVVSVVLYLLHKRTEVSSTLLSILGVGLVAIYLTVAIFVGLLNL